jgi:p-hydroxybenzoate 3-monooxygenase
MRTQVAIIGAGPAGLFLAHLLRLHGVAATVLERRDRAYVEGRVRAGVLEQITIDVMARLGLDGRLRTQGLLHDGTNLVSDGEMFRVDMAARTGGRRVAVYGQQEVMHDLFEAAAAEKMPILFEAEDVVLHDVAGGKPFVTWQKAGVEARLDCDFIAGCDGFHGVSRDHIPQSARRNFERVYPFGWLGILADVPPAHHELIYANHANGFALASMRSPTRSRYYLQCGLDEKIEDWPDTRFWDEVTLRLGPQAHVTRGPSFEKSIAPLRSFVTEPMRHGSLFLLGDAAHIVPPTGAKGLNLAASDVGYLAAAMRDHYLARSDEGIAAYSQRCLSRIWKAERFSWWFTSLMHKFPETGEFGQRMQHAELDYLVDSPAASTALAENYVGLPMDLPVPSRVVVAHP